MHGNAAGIVYADGHSDVHVWRGSVTTQPFNPNYNSYLQGVSVTGDPASKNDLTWLAQHTPRIIDFTGWFIKEFLIHKGLLSATDEGPIHIGYYSLDDAQ